jgi:hypothetical protein
MHHYVITFVSDLRQVDGFLRLTDHNFSSAQGNAHQNSIHSNMFHLMGSMLTRLIKHAVLS